MPIPTYYDLCYIKPIPAEKSQGDYTIRYQVAGVLGAQSSKKIHF